MVANASNTVGMAPAGLSGSFGYRRERGSTPKVTVAVLTTCAAGSVAGAFLLLALPPGVSEAVVPWLILGTSVLVGIQPLGWSRKLREMRGGEVPDRVHMSPPTTVWATLTGVYGGYFGAGSGVMMLAVLGFGTDLELRILNALKTLAVMAANVVATVIFLVLADLDWLAIGLLAVRLGGGRVRRVPHRPPPPADRAPDGRRDRGVDRLRRPPMTCRVHRRGLGPPAGAADPEEGGGS